MTCTRNAALLGVFVPFVLSAPALAQAPPDADVIVTTGEAVVRSAPDVAHVTIATTARARSPKDAQKLSSAAMTEVLRRVADAGVPREAVRTQAVDLQPQFDYTNGRQTLREYLARNGVDVRVDDLSRLADVIDAAVAGGSNELGDIRFDLKDRSALEREALRLAVADARARAEAMATGASRAVDRILRVEDQRSTVVPPPSPRVMMAAAPPAEVATPIAPGQLEVRASVTLTARLK